MQTVKQEQFCSTSTTYIVQWGVFTRLCKKLTFFCHRYRFRDVRLLQLALRHSSAGTVNNSQLAWLGASLLPLLAASEEYSARPSADRKGAPLFTRM